MQNGGTQIPQLRPAAVKLLAALEAAQGQPRDAAQLARWVAHRYGVQLAAPTVRVQLAQLRARGLARHVDTEGGRQWVAASTAPESEPPDSARVGTGTTEPVWQHHGDPAQRETPATVNDAPGDPDAVPVVPVAMVEGRDERERWAVWCPHCGEQHVHAAGAGLRAARCGRGTYVIAEPLRSTR